MLNNTISTTRSGLLLQIISIMNPCDMCLWSNQNYFRPFNVFNKVLQYLSHWYAKFKCPLCDYLDGFNCPILFSATSVVKCIERSASDTIFNFYGAGISCSTLFSQNIIVSLSYKRHTKEFHYIWIRLLTCVFCNWYCRVSHLRVQRDFLMQNVLAYYQTITQTQYVIIFELH